MSVLRIRSAVPPVLISSDLHLVESPNEAYRWKLFDWVIRQVTAHRLDYWLILGDVLDKKDRHPAELVNHVVDQLARVVDAGLQQIYILQGNHDYLKAGSPYLRFLNRIPQIKFITAQETIRIYDSSTLWLPHTKTPLTDWAEVDFTGYDYIFLHQSVIGSQVSNYFEMKEGLDAKLFEGSTAWIYSGDIHVPQNIKIKNTKNGLTYIGTPYPIAFGDVYTCRSLLVNMATGKATDVHVEELQNFKKLSLRISAPNQLYTSDLTKGTHAKVVLQLTTAEQHLWPKYKTEIQQWFEQTGATLFDLKLEIASQHIKQLNTTTPYATKLPATTVLEQYAEIEKLDPTLLQVGLDLISATRL